MAIMKATKRAAIGTNKVRQLRKTGHVPGVVYGHGEEPVSISVSEHEVELLLQHGERVLELDIDGQMQNVLIKDVQYDTLSHEVLHVDLARVNLDERVEVTVAVTLVGTPEGAKEGGVLQQAISEINLECPVRSIPEEIKMIVTGLKLNDRVHLSDVPLPEGAKLLDTPTDILCMVAEVAEEEEVEGGEAMAEPEVIGAKKDDAEAAE